MSCNNASIAVSWLRTMDSQTEVFARHVYNFPGVDSMPLGWRSNSRTNEDLRDFWYVGDSRENVDQHLARDRFFRDGETVEMPILFKH